MQKNLKRAAVVAAAAGVIGAGSMVAAGPAHAAGDLKVAATVKCQHLAGKNYTQRLVAVTNVGDQAITGVRVGSVAGPEATIPALEADKPKSAGGLLFASNAAIDAGTLKPGQTVVAAQSSSGCSGPYAIVGYSIGDQIDNVFSAPNYDFDWGTVIDLLPAASA